MVTFVDTHAHLLAGFDDGSPSWEISLQMLQQGYDDGIREVVCTPHILSIKDFARQDLIIELYEELKMRAKHAHIDMIIHLGSELFIQPDLDLNSRIATPANNGRYFLVEFPMNLIPDFVANTFFELVIKGKVPVVAHPERYMKILIDPQKAVEFVERGALLQINAGSLLGVFGQMVREVAIKLMDANLVSLIASDAHDVKNRPLKLRAAYDFVVATWGTVKANRLFIENPKRILSGQDIIAEEPRPLNTLEKKNFFQKLGSFFTSPEKRYD